MRLKMDHIVLNVENMDEMAKFYWQILQLQPERLDEYRAGRAPFPSLRVNKDTIIDLFPKEAWARNGQRKIGPGNLNHFCLSMAKSEWDRLLEMLKVNSIPVESGPVKRYGAHGTGTSVYFRDPDGNQIEARYYAVEDAVDHQLLGS
jgi:catechol-2,3-dioxygenase